MCLLLISVCKNLVVFRPRFVSTSLQLHWLEISSELQLYRRKIAFVAYFCNQAFPAKGDFSNIFGSIKAIIFKAALYISQNNILQKTFLLINISLMFLQIFPYCYIFSIASWKAPPATIGLFRHFGAQQISGNSFPISGSITLNSSQRG